MHLIANKAMRYDGRWLKIGDRFEAAEPYAKTLIAVKQARRVIAEPEQQRQDIIEPEQPRKKRKYNRRDMTAADEVSESMTSQDWFSKL